MNGGARLIFGNNRRGSKGLRRQRGKDGIFGVATAVFPVLRFFVRDKKPPLTERGVVMGFVATGSCISRVKHDDSGHYRQIDMGIESR